MMAAGWGHEALAQEQPQNAPATPKAVAAPENPLAGSEQRVFKKIGDVELKLHVFKPADWRAGDNRPAIVFFFGGGWLNGTPAQFAPQAKYLASRGMVAICPEYRIYSRHQVEVVQCVADAKSALRWVRSHSAELGIHPCWIAAGGGSAGGHLAACLATIDSYNDPQDDLTISCVPNVLVLFNPALDLTMEGLQRKADDAFYQNISKRFGAEAMHISPAAYVRNGMPPAIIFHGTDDKTVPIAQVKEFSRKMLGQCNYCEVVDYPGRDHGFFNADQKDRQPYFDTLRRTDDFLARCGFLCGPPTLVVPAESAAGGASATKGPTDP